MRQDAIRPSLVSVCRLLADGDSETVTASLHVLMCHAVLQLRAAGRHPPQSGVRLSPAGGRRQRDRHRVSTCPDVSRRVTAACGRTPSAPVWCPSVACWRTATTRPSPRLSTCPDVSRRVTAACGRTPSAPVWCPSVACWRTVTARPSPRLYMS